MISITQPPSPPIDRHVRRTGNDYAQAFLSLLPQGQAWPRYQDSTLVLTCTGLSLYWGFVDGRAADLLETESDPRKTVELLPDWERNWGLPDPCFPAATSISERQHLLVMIMTLLGGQSRAFFQQISHWTGYTISVKEWAPFMVGVSEVGDTRYEYDFLKSLIANAVPVTFQMGEQSFFCTVRDLQWPEQMITGFNFQRTGFNGILVATLVTAEM